MSMKPRTSMEIVRPTSETSKLSLGVPLVGYALTSTLRPTLTPVAAAFLSAGCRYIGIAPSPVGVMGWKLAATLTFPATSFSTPLDFGVRLTESALDEVPGRAVGAEAPYAFAM